MTSGSHVHTPRLLNSGELDLVVYSSGQSEFGMYLNSGALYITSDSGGIFGINPGSSSGLLSGMGSVNMLSPSGVNDNYFVTVGSLESGVTVGQRFITGAKRREKDDDSLDNLKRLLMLEQIMMPLLESLLKMLVKYLQLYSY
jgi:hypothetical protein